MEHSFGSYRFDGGTGRLWTGDREIRLTPKASAVLKILVTNAGEPVSARVSRRN
jgi:DNA-binding winged helix-turn-helix (wHTH) protein